MNDLISKMQCKNFSADLRESTRCSAAVDHPAFVLKDNSSRRKIITYTASTNTARR